MTPISSTTIADEDVLTPPSASGSTLPSTTGPRDSASTGTGNRLLWLALGLGVAYMAYKQLPQGRRYLRIERM